MRLAKHIMSADSAHIKLASSCLAARRYYIHEILTFHSRWLHDNMLTCIITVYSRQFTDHMTTGQAINTILCSICEAQRWPQEV